jgi:stage V sporulation protein B
LAGNFITILAWICPFLYLNTTLTSVLNGLGRTNVTFLNGICSLFIRITFIYRMVPRIGIHGYLFGLLASQLFLSATSLVALKRTLNNT